MNSRLILAAILVALVHSDPTLELAPASEDFPPKWPIPRINFPRISSLQDQNLALLAENNALKAKNGQLQKDINDYIDGIREIIRRLLEKYRQNLTSPLLRKGAASTELDAKIAELKDLEATFQTGKGSDSSPLTAQKLPWDKIAKTLRLIADIIDIWKN